MAKRCSVVCGGFLLLLGCCLGAAKAQAQVLWMYHDAHTVTSDPPTIGLMNAGSPFDPASLIHGSLPGPGPFDQIAVEQHVLQNKGDVVPLPTYADGTTALESEVFWTVHLWNATFSADWCPFPAKYISGDMVRVGFDGRTYTGGFGALENTYLCAGQFGAQAHDVAVLVTVIAVRKAFPVGTSATPWGRLKVRYR